MNMLEILTVIRYSSWMASIFVNPDIIWAVWSGSRMLTEACWMASQRLAIAILSLDEEDMVIDNVMVDEVMEWYDIVFFFCLNSHLMGITDGTMHEYFDTSTHMLKSKSQETHWALLLYQDILSTCCLFTTEQKYGFKLVQNITFWCTPLENSFKSCIGFNSL